MSMVTCALRFSYDSIEEADGLLQALKVDDGIYIHTTRNECVLEATAEADSIQSLMHTINDYLACLSAAERLVLQR